MAHKKYKKNTGKTVDAGAPSNKNKAKYFKFFGAIILAASFITQNYFYDKWSAESRDLQDATANQAIIDKGTQLAEILYFTAGLDKNVLPEDEVQKIKEQYIQQAAIKQVLSHAMATASTNLGKNEKSRVISKFLDQAHNVRDFHGFNELRREVNQSNEEGIQKKREDRSQDVDDKRETARYVYLVLYVFGSILVLIGIKYD